ncbi:hypothetical protein Tco_1196646 [Tanacetum coccineum]
MDLISYDVLVQQVEREITPKREIQSARTASPPSPLVIAPPTQARKGPHQRQTAQIRAADPPNTGLIIENKEFHDRLNIQLQGMHNLSASIESLLLAIEWANDNRDEIQASNRRAGMWALLAGH